MYVLALPWMGGRPDGFPGDLVAAILLALNFSAGRPQSRPSGDLAVVRIRMKRMGRPHRPFYRINAVDARVKRDGKVIENLGWYDPMAEDKARQVGLNAERVKYWLSKGAQPSETLMDLLSKQNLVDGDKWAKSRAWRVEAKKKAIAAKAAQVAAGEAKKAEAPAKA